MMILRLLRVKQWIKNGFIALPLIFSGEFLMPGLGIECAKVVAGFCLVSSALYILNDLKDGKQDAFHPTKKLRPIAAGKISRREAVLVMLLCATAGVAVLSQLHRPVWAFVAAYALIQVLYNYVTKNHVILDVLTIAAGFQLRVWIGGAALGITPSLWLQLCVFVLALFLGFSKRRYEMAILKEKATEHRGALAQYTIAFLDQLIMISSSLAVIFYGLYTISPEVTSRMGGNVLLYSMVFVIYGIFRYLYLIQIRHLGDDPGEVLLSDPPLLINITLWLFFVMSLIILNKTM